MIDEPRTVLLVDDHALVREMFTDRLRASGYRVVAAETTETAVDLARAHRPDLAVLDIDVPGPSVFDVARILRDEHPPTKVVFLSAYVRDTYIGRALEVEAAGYLCKCEDPDTVLAAIDAVMAGATRFSPAVLSRIEIGPRGPRLPNADVTPLSSLTEREREVLTHIARGRPQKQVAVLLGISIKTVQHHLDHVMSKLGSHDRVELARFAIREGLIEP